MAWLRIDDTVPEHRKMLQAGPAACWLWVCGIAYCQRQLTDGFIPALALPMIGVTGASRAKKLADALVTAGLFEVVDGGYRVHDYHDHNATAQEAAAHRARITEQRATAGRIGGIRSGISRREATKQTASNTPKQNEAPSHPDIKEPPNPPSGGLLAGEVRTAATQALQASATVLADTDVAERAAAFLERYPATYAKARNGAHYRVKEARDFPTALELVTAWPDAQHLDDMLRLFLMKKDFAPKNEPGSPGQFAFMAPQCDALLRAARRA